MARKKKQVPENVTAPDDAVDIENTPKKAASEEGDSAKIIVPERLAIIAGALMASELRIGAPRVLYDLYRDYKESGKLPDEKFVNRARQTLKSILTNTAQQNTIESEIQKAVAFLDEMLSD